MLGVPALIAALLVPAIANGSGAASGSAASAAAPHTNLATANVRLKRIISGLSSPVALAWRKTDKAHIYVAQQSGSVVRIANGRVVSTVLTLGSIARGGEQGLLGIAFSRDGKVLYVDYTDPSGDIHVVSYSMNGAVANRATRRQLLAIPHHDNSNHNGGNLVLGPDNMLYISVGDGGGGGDVPGNAQNLGVLLGKILRINPRAAGAAEIPAGNPFKGQAGKRGAIWMYGLRNPWRFSFDRKTHDMWIGDVGQGLYEEVDFARAGRKGIIWGWNLREGFHPYNGGARPAGAHDPILERPHSDRDCAIIGGYVYRGAPTLKLAGAYIFGDECTGVLRAVTQSGGHVIQRADLHLNVSQLSSFGEGPSGGIYAVSVDGSIYVLAAA